MPSLSATITAVSSQSAAFTQERTKFLSAPSSRLLARALEARRVMRRIATKQITNTMSAESSVISETPPIEIVSSPPNRPDPAPPAAEVRTVLKMPISV